MLHDTFNTGRGYSSEGQQIDYKVKLIESDDLGKYYHIAFYDRSRLITGIATLLLWPEDTLHTFDIENAIMRDYDSMTYKSITLHQYSNFED